jgi:DNA-directed RNA polymerase subunit RPC12/RpoP
VAAHDAGVEVECPACGQVVLQKAMIPTLGHGGPGLRYLCAACARALIAPIPLEGDEVAGGTAADPVVTAD